MATGRIIVHEDIAERFVAGLKEGIRTMASSLTSLPLLVSTASKARLQKLVSASLKAGAVSEFGDDPLRTTMTDTAFVPMILRNANENTDIWQEEVFGPVVPFKVVQGDEEAIRVANDTKYGLSASIFSQDLRKAFSIAKRLEAGSDIHPLQCLGKKTDMIQIFRAVHINSMTVHDEASLPHGGIKNSGWGRFNSSAGMEEFLVTKTITWDD
jgi:acyl-CoA reductase-like NAD-dependent aldehyde dehydrogenase